MGNLGFWEIMMIALAVLLLFGAKRLPEIGASMGKGIREFKRSLSDTQDAIMGQPEDRTQPPPRQLDGPAAPGGGGEPKRLSQ
ncbi:MAG TPA: twin-arginine translocase TatA/TatE family subunit [Gemmatimonadales bacterium]|nr:twin-arginine translocase TatA/TatE family subunit [Gemmatimonadales bacterium]